MNRTPAQERVEKKRKLALQQMGQRIIEYDKAKTKPDIRIGSERKPSGAVIPKTHPEAFQRLDQLNHEDRWGRTTFTDAGLAKVTVQDPRDANDVVLPTITAEKGPLRQITVDDAVVDAPVHKVKEFQLTLPLEEGTEGL